MRRLYLFCLFMLFLPKVLSFALDLKPSGFVNDFAAILDKQDAIALDNFCRDIESKTGVEIAVVTIETLGGRSIETYANEIFNSWGIGKKGKDNGVLFLVSVRDRKVRIEVGYGLEPVLTDGICGQIIRDIIAPEFRKNNYFAGLKNAIVTVSRLIEGDSSSNAFPQKKLIGAQNAPPFFFVIFWQGMCLLFAFFILGRIGLGIQAGLILLLDVTVGVGGRQNPSYIMLALLIPFFMIFIFGFLVAPILYAILKPKLKRYYGSGWKEHWPVWIGSYSSTAGGGFGGGGGSFGGGSSGGGGASGGW